jgi:phosphoglycolate phosphatase
MRSGAGLVAIKTSTSVDAVLFDLDGTLVHTAPCIAAALNQSLALSSTGPVDPAVTTTMIGGGVPTLIERALARLGKAQDPVLAETILANYRRFYLQDPVAMPVSFPGVETALVELQRLGLKLGVVTNTFDRFVHAILKHTNLSRFFDVVVSADTLPERKPHPAPLLHACRALGVDARSTLFIGDSRNDAEAAQAAHMRMVCMTYGYNEGRPATELPCLAFLAEMSALPPLLLEWRKKGDANLA